MDPIFVPQINFVDPNWINRVVYPKSGGVDLISTYRGSQEQLHVHDHGDGSGQTISVYEKGLPIAKITYLKK